MGYDTQLEFRAAAKEVGSTPRQVSVWPRSEAATVWLISNYERIDAIFREVHQPGDPGLSQYHPHGILLERPDLADLDPDEPRVHLYVGAHWDSVHETLTKDHILRALSLHGAPLAEMEIQTSSEDG